MNRYWHYTVMILITLLIIPLWDGVLNPAPVAAQSATTQRVKLYFILEKQNGKGGKRIGCDDTLTFITQTIEVKTNVVNDTFDALLKLKTPYYRKTKLYNPLHRYTLQAATAGVNSSGTAYISLWGSFMPKQGFYGFDECEFLRLKAQLEETLLQFSTSQQMILYVNGNWVRLASGRTY